MPLKCKHEDLAQGGFDWSQADGRQNELSIQRKYNESKSRVSFWGSGRTAVSLQRTRARPLRNSTVDHGTSEWNRLRLIEVDTTGFEKCQNHRVLCSVVLKQRLHEWQTSSSWVPPGFSLSLIGPTNHVSAQALCADKFNFSEHTEQHKLTFQTHAVSPSALRSTSRSSVAARAAAIQTRSVSSKPAPIRYDSDCRCSCCDQEDGDRVLNVSAPAAQMLWHEKAANRYLSTPLETAPNMSSPPQTKS